MVGVRISFSMVQGSRLKITAPMRACFSISPLIESTVAKAAASTSYLGRARAGSLSTVTITVFE